MPAQAGITTPAPSWLRLAAADVSGDVSLASSVTYFVHDIVPFIEKMVTASRRRVMITPLERALAQPECAALSPRLRRRASACPRD